MDFNEIQKIIMDLGYEYVVDDQYTKNSLSFSVYFEKNYISYWFDNDDEFDDFSFDICGKIVELDKISKKELKQYIQNLESKREDLLNAIEKFRDYESGMGKI